MLLRRCCRRDAYISYRAVGIPTDIPEPKVCSITPPNSVLGTFLNNADSELRYKFSKTGNVPCNVTLRSVRVTILTAEKPIIITYSAFMFVACVRVTIVTVEKPF